MIANATLNIIYMTILVNIKIVIHFKYNVFVLLPIGGGKAGGCTLFSRPPVWHRDTVLLHCVVYNQRNTGWHCTYHPHTVESLCK